MERLAEATDVVAILTEQSISRPWILYEAGVAKGTANDRVVFGIALGIPLAEALTGPFTQFQNSPDEEDAIKGIVLQLIRRNPEAEPREEAVRHHVREFRQKVRGVLENRGTEPRHHEARVDETSVAKFFEEMKVLVRDVLGQVARELGSDPSAPAIRRKPRPRILEMEKLIDQPLQLKH
jgi:hypothetical protein